MVEAGEPVGRGVDSAAVPGHNGLRSDPAREEVSMAHHPDTRDEHRETPFHWTAVRIGIMLVGILALSILVGALIKNLNQTRMVGIFAVGVMSFLGMLTIGH